jgi:hypothetical protein
MIIEALLEVVRYSVPALVVYFLMRQFYRQQYAIEISKNKAALSNEQVGLRLQAYERLALLTERIGIPGLIIRLNTGDITASNLQSTLLIAVQKEYEHNLSQQIYISSQLWQMMTLLKEETQASITNAYAALEKEDKSEFISNLYQIDSQSTKAIGNKVRMGIRKEVELYFS